MVVVVEDGSSEQHTRSKEKGGRQAAYTYILMCFI